jgi:hypothetical protein
LKYKNTLNIKRVKFINGKKMAQKINLESRKSLVNTNMFKNDKNNPLNILNDNVLISENYYPKEDDILKYFDYELFKSNKNDENSSLVNQLRKYRYHTITLFSFYI